MTGSQSRLGDITDQAARALDLIAAIEAHKQAGPGFWIGALKLIVLDLDEVGLGREVVRIGDFLAAAYGKLEDRPEPEADLEELERLLREWRGRG